MKTTSRRRRRRSSKRKRFHWWRDIYLIPLALITVGTMWLVMSHVKFAPYTTKVPKPASVRK